MKELELETDEIKKFERTNITLYKAKNNKSVTLPIKLTDFAEGETELILNVSLKGLSEFLTDERFKSFRWNKIRKL